MRGGEANANLKAQAPFENNFKRRRNYVTICNVLFVHERAENQLKCCIEHSRMLYLQDDIES